MQDARLRTVVTASVTALVLAAAPASAANAEKVVGEMREALDPAGDMRATIELTMSNPFGEEVVWTGEYFRKSGEDGWKRIVFHQPMDLRGTEYTVRNNGDGLDQIGLWLPALRRYQRIRTEVTAEPFLGTDFTYESLGFEQVQVEDHEIVGDDTIGKREVWKIVSEPAEDARVWYGKIVRLVAKDTHLPVRTEYHDKSDILYKLQTIDRIETIEGHPTPVEITMRTVPENTWTRLELTDVRYDTGLDDKLIQKPYSGRP